MNLVTGGGGFLGSHIVRALLQRGQPVRILARSPYPELRELGVEGVQGDVRTGADVERAMKGVHSVFHVAARVGFWGPRSEYWSTNVQGTQHLLDAARRAGVRRFVYTSTPSVAIGPEGAAPGTKETDPLPTRYLSDYGRTKREAERRVLEAHSQGSFHTVSLRPHFIFGPRDPQLVPRLLRAREQGRLVQVGDGSNWTDVTYIDNCVDAHVQAWEALSDRLPACGGRAYFLGQEEPIRLWDFVGRVLSGFGLPAVDRRLSFRVAYALGACIEAVYRMGRVASEPPLTRMAAVILGKDHCFDHGAAARDFGFAPRISLSEGLQRTFAQPPRETEA